MDVIVALNELSTTEEINRFTIILLHVVIELLISIGIVSVVGVLYAADTINGRVYMVLKLISAP